MIISVILALLFFLAVNNQLFIWISLSQQFPFENSTLPTNTGYVITAFGLTYTLTDTTGNVIYSGSSASTAIQSAINNLTPNRTSKEKILLQGDFTLTNTITIANYMILELNGKITLANAVNKYILYGSGKSNFEIRGGEWNGNKAGQTLTSSSVRGIELESCTDFTISGITMHDTVDDGIAAITCLRVTVNFNTIYNTAGALNLAYTSNSQINNNTCHDTTAGIYLYTEDDGIVQHVDNNVVTGNICYNIYHTGISISLRGPEDTGMGNTIADNTVYDCGTDGSHAHMNMGWSLGSASGARFAANNLFTRNKVYDTGAYVCGPGVSISGVDNEISYNKIHDLTYSALTVTGERNKIQNNTISITNSPSSFGIELWIASNCNVAGNTIDRVGNCGIWLVHDGVDCNNNIIDGNSIISPGNYGVNISAGNANQVINNKFYHIASQNMISNIGTNTVIQNNTNYP